MPAQDNFSERVTIYAPGATIGSDLNVLPNKLAKVGANIACNLHRGSRQSKDDATLLGILNTSTANGYFAVAAAPLLRLRAVILDQFGDYWLVRNTTLRNRFPETAHVRCLLTYLNVKPDIAS